MPIKQLSMFDKTTKNAELSKAIDIIRRKYGEDIIKSASLKNANFLR